MFSFWDSLFNQNRGNVEELGNWINFLQPLPENFSALSLAPQECILRYCKYTDEVKKCLFDLTLNNNGSVLPFKTGPTLADDFTLMGWLDSVLMKANIKTITDRKSYIKTMFDQHYYKIKYYRNIAIHVLYQINDIIQLTQADVLKQRATFLTALWPTNKRLNSYKTAKKYRNSGKYWWWVENQGTNIYLCTLYNTQQKRLSLKKVDNECVVEKYDTKELVSLFKYYTSLMDVGIQILPSDKIKTIQDFFTLSDRNLYTKITDIELEEEKKIVFNTPENFNEILKLPLLQPKMLCIPWSLFKTYPNLKYLIIHLLYIYPSVTTISMILFKFDTDDAKEYKFLENYLAKKLNKKISFNYYKTNQFPIHLHQANFFRKQDLPSKRKLLMQVYLGGLLSSDIFSYPFNDLEVRSFLPGVVKSTVASSILDSEILTIVHSEMYVDTTCEFLSFTTNFDKFTYTPRVDHKYTVHTIVEIPTQTHPTEPEEVLNTFIAKLVIQEIKGVIFDFDQTITVNHTQGKELKEWTCSPPAKDLYTKLKNAAFYVGIASYASLLYSVYVSLGDKRELKKEKLDKISKNYPGVTGIRNWLANQGMPFEVPIIAFQPETTFIYDEFFSSQFRRDLIELKEERRLLDIEASPALITYYEGQPTGKYGTDVYKDDKMVWRWTPKGQHLRVLTERFDLEPSHILVIDDSNEVLIYAQSKGYKTLLVKERKGLTLEDIAGFPG